MSAAGGDADNVTKPPPPPPQTDTEADHAGLRELRAECEHAWTKVKEAQSQVEGRQQPPCSALSSDQAPLVSILREKERQLRAEIEVAKELEPQTPPKNTQVVKTALLEDLHREVGRLKETLSLVESQREELQASIQQEAQYQQQLLAVSEKLQERCEGLEVEQPPEDAVDTVAQELEAKINQARQTERSIMKSMADFINNHFPLPDPAQVSKVSKDLRSRKQQSKQETLPLKDILLELMTKCVESPSDPYMELTDRHWPAYTELLLRCNIILQHPDDDRRVRLVPFHL